MNGFEIAMLARSWIGTPYRNMTAVKGHGADCIGLVRGVWAEVYGELPPIPMYTALWRASSGNPEELLEALAKYLVEVPIGTRKPGIVLVFRMRSTRPAQHCGVMTSQTNMVHSHSGQKVYEVTLGAKWESRVVAAFKFPKVED